MTIPTCETCRTCAFHSIFSECRRHPPGPDGFTQTKVTDWCGEWQARDLTPGSPSDPLAGHETTLAEIADLRRRAEEAEAELKEALLKMHRMEACISQLEGENLGLRTEKTDLNVECARSKDEVRRLSSILASKQAWLDDLIELRDKIRMLKLDSRSPYSYYVQAFREISKMAEKQ